MNHALRFLLLAGCLGLAACDGAGDTAAPQVSAVSASAASQPVADNGTELKSADGKITVKTFGVYRDVMAEAEARPDGVPPEQLLLLQHNDAYNTTVYAARLGKTTQTPEAYLGKLKKAVENGKGLKNQFVGEQEQGERMSYRFSQTDSGGDIALNESCTVLLHDGEIYNVCAFSAEVQPEDLAEVIQDIAFKP